MNLKAYAPIGFLILAIVAIILPKDIFTAILIFLMILSGTIAIYTNIDVFDDDERDKKNNNEYIYINNIIYF